MLSSFKTGQSVVVSERWRGLLWSAIPHRCIASDDQQLITYLPKGTIAAYASNRELPETKQLPRSERKLQAMQTCVYEPVERKVGLAQLHFYRPNRMAHVNLGWTDEGNFTGWYVNFELAPAVTSDGLESKDLVLDMTISPDYRWQWKDRTDFEEAVQRGILGNNLDRLFREEARRMLVLCESRDGPFAPSWRTWWPDPQWSLPELPPAYRANGRLWKRS